MRNSLGDKARLEHILDAILEIEKYLSVSNFDAFMENSMMRFASIKQMEIIGEASNHLSDEIKKEFANVQWDQIIGMRNVFVHEYFGIDSNLAWEIIKKDLPDLKVTIVLMLKVFEIKP